MVIDLEEKSKMRKVYLDIAKGLGIFLVVWAHARAPYSAYMYLFHMPLFFLISGYLYNSKKGFKDFFVGKFKTIYIPFVVWNLLAVLIKTIVHPDMLRNNIKAAVKILLTLDKDGQFFGATWFLASLFVISIMYKFLDVYIKECKYKYVFITGCFVAMGIMGFEITFPYMFSRTLILGMFYAIGYMVHIYKQELYEFFRPALAWLAFVIFFVTGHFNSAGMGTNTYKAHFTFVFGAVLASYSIVYLSMWIEKVQYITVMKKIQTLLSYLGKKSIDILIWQFVAFRVVIAAQLYLDGISWNEILEYYPVYNTNGGWWFVYTIVGLFLPILWGNFLRLILERCKHILSRKC